MTEQIVIVTGLDVLGKTWLCEQLKEVYSSKKAAVRKLDDGGDIDSTGQWRDGRLRWASKEATDWGGRMLIYDRFPYPDESAYGFMSFEEILWWEETMKRYGDVSVILAMPDNLVEYKNRLALSRDSYLVPKSELIYESYKKFTEYTRLDLKVLWLDDLIREEHLEEVVRWLDIHP